MAASLGTSFFKPATTFHSTCFSKHTNSSSSSSKFSYSFTKQQRKSSSSCIVFARTSSDVTEEAASSSSSSTVTQTKSFPGKPEADVVVIGSGLGGLCCAGLLARYGKDVLVLESHDLPGGAAHSFEIKDYKFDSGPSLFSGFQSRGLQANPLAQVLDALGESIPCAKYDSWMVYVPEGEFLSRIGPTEFYKDLETYAGPNAVLEWRKLLDSILPLSAAAMALPPLSIRGDLGVLSTAGARYALSLLKSFAQMGPQGALGATKLLRPFSEVVDSLGLKDPFIRNWIDLLSFLLAGVKSDGVLSAEMIYMFAEWYKPGCSLEYPLGGSGALVDALVRGLQKFGGRIALKSHVENIVVENGRAVGVKLRSGQFVRAKKAVVSNASMWDTLKLLPKEVVPNSYEERIQNTKQCESFMHLHLGFDAENRMIEIREEQPELIDEQIIEQVLETRRGFNPGQGRVVLRGSSSSSSSVRSHPATAPPPTQYQMAAMANFVTATHQHVKNLHEHLAARNIIDLPQPPVPDPSLFMNIIEEEEEEDVAQAESE